MTSLEAFEEMIEILNNYHHQIVKAGDICRLWQRMGFN